MSIVNKTELKKLVGDFKLANEFYPAIDTKVEHMVREAMERAKANQRRTLMGRDI
ncbi:MAG: hypothetical protein V1859_08010 [archaeon]